MSKFLVGNYTDKINRTGVTVVLAPEGAVGGVAVMGGAPGTRETDLLKGCNAVDKVNAVVLSGGSAFGLEASCGVMDFLAERSIGFRAGNHVVPIVCSAVLFDLDYGTAVAPDKRAGYLACQNAAETFETGSVGAGTGATVGKIAGMEHCQKGGLGTAEIRLGEAYVRCVVAVNALGDVIDVTRGGEIVAGARTGEDFLNTSKVLLKGNVPNLAGQNTTIACVCTNAILTREQANKLAAVAHDGYALAISPVHTMLDGDTVFCLASGEVAAEFHALTAATVEAVRRAILNAVEVSA